MFPAQTSMMPVVVALARFLENEGLRAIFNNYPFWYLGSTPFRYLTGPILPLILTLNHRFLPNFSMFEIFFFWVVLSWIAGTAGVYFLVKNLGTGERCKAFTAALFYLVGPIVPLLFRFADGLYLMAFSTLPWILFCYLKFLQNPRRRWQIVLIALITLALLTDTLILPSLFLGMTAIFLAQVGWRRAEEKIKKSLWLVAYSLLLATIWYGLGYWWTLLGAPSFGGKGLGQVIFFLGKLLPITLATILAVVSVRFFKRRDILRDFCFIWLFIFGFLTLIRFLSDPDFWQDWTGYGIELQFGLAIGLGIISQNLRARIQNYADFIEHPRQSRDNSKVKSLGFLLAFFALYFSLFIFIFNRYVLGTLQKDITQTVEYRIGNQLNQIIQPGEKVFLSGTTAFWLNAFFEIPQVRGGRDQASTNNRWREAAWEVREGNDIERSVKLLKELEVNYLVVHAGASKEFYHDFVYPEKFKNTKELRVISAENADIIYRLE